MTDLLISVALYTFFRRIDKRMCIMGYIHCSQHGSLRSPDIRVSSVISGFCRDINEICGLLGYYAASNGNPLTTFRDNVSIPLDP